jgi:hypothetical protein
MLCPVDGGFGRESCDRDWVKKWRRSTKKARKACLFRRSCVFDLGGFVANGGPDFIREVCRQFVHAMLSATVFGALFQNVLYGLAPPHEVTVDAHSLQLTIFAILPALRAFDVHVLDGRILALGRSLRQSWDSW